MVVWVILKRSRRVQLMPPRMALHSDMGISAMVTWLARAWEFEPRLQTWRSWTSRTPETDCMASRMVPSCRLRGVPSRRMFRVSRMMPMELQRIMAAMMMERMGSIQVMPVKRMAAPPTMTAAVERVSPSMWRKTLRMLTSPEKRQRRVATVPFMRTPAADDHHDAWLDGDGDGEA